MHDFSTYSIITRPLHLNPLISLTILYFKFYLLISIVKYFTNETYSYGKISQKSRDAPIIKSRSFPVSQLWLPIVRDT